MLLVETACLHEITLQQARESFVSDICLEVTEESHKTSVLYTEEPFHFFVCKQ